MSLAKTLQCISVLVVSLTISGCTDTAPIPTTRLSAPEMAACGVDEPEHERLITLSRNKFDQDMQGGWRSVAQTDGCTKAAAQLLEDYIDRHNIAPDEGSNILFWHVGQLKAEIGDYDAALIYFEQSYDHAAENGTHEKEWALYAQGTIAFINRDLAALKAARTELATYKTSPERLNAVRKMMAKNPDMKFPEGYPEKPLNVIALDGLIACFDFGYDKAYGGRCHPE